MIKAHRLLSRRPELEAWSFREEWRWPVTIALGLFLFYAWCSPRTVALEDDGLFIMASYFNGIAHPPGYPLFTLIGHIFSQLPFGNVAWRVHLVSALFGGLACAVLWGFVRSLVPSRLIAASSALAYGFSEAFWSQAIITEVYTLNAFLTFLLAYMLLQIAGRMGGRNLHGSGGLGWQAAGALGLLYGLGLSNHWPLLVLFSPAYMILAWPVIAPLMRRWLPLLMGLCLGLLPYAWLYLRSQMGPEISYAGTISGWSEFLGFISRSSYAGADHEAGVVWADKVAYMALLGRSFVEQTTFVGLCLAIVGLISTKSGQRVAIAGLLLGAGGVSILLVWLLDREFSLLGSLIFRVYPIPAYGVMAILMGLGLDRIWKWMRTSKLVTVKKGLLLGVGMLVPASSLVAHAGHNFRAGYTWAERYAKAVLDESPDRAQILLRSDVEVFVVGYKHRVDGYRPDVRLHATGGRVFGDSTRSQHSSDGAGPWVLARKEANRGEVGMFCFVGADEPAGAIDHGLVLNGLTSCYSADIPGGRASLLLTPRALSRLLAVQVYDGRDAWTRMAIDVMNAQLMPVLLRARSHASVTQGPWRSALDEAIRNALTGVTGKLAYLDYTLGDGTATKPEFAREVLSEALAQADQAPAKSVLVRLYLHAFRQHMPEDGGGDPEALLWKAVELQPTLNNPALPPLLTRLVQSGRQEDVSRLAGLSEELRGVAILHAHFVSNMDAEMESITIKDSRGSLTIDAGGNVKFE